MLRLRQIKLKVTKQVFFTFLSLLDILFHWQKVSLYKKIPLYIVSKNCLGKQFSNKFLWTSSTNGSLKNVLCSKSILSCNNSCAESSSHFEHAKNWFLNKRLDTNLYQVLIVVKYTRDLQLGSKKNFQDLVVKPIIFMTQKWSFPLRIYLINASKSAVLRGYVHIY